MHLMAIVICVSAIALTACGESSEERQKQYDAELSAGAVWQADAPRRTFRGYNCTQDCSGHEAGYNWAEEKGITDPDDCGGNAHSFIEGCIAYAEEQ